MRCVPCAPARAPQVITQSSLGVNHRWKSSANGLRKLTPQYKAGAPPPPPAAAAPAAPFDHSVTNS